MLEKKKLNAKREAEDAKVNESIRRKGGQDQVRCCSHCSAFPGLTQSFRLRSPRLRPISLSRKRTRTPSSARRVRPPPHLRQLR